MPPRRRRLRQKLSASNPTDTQEHADEPKTTIANLPFEILREILTLVCAEPECVVVKTDNGKTRLIPQALALRHVSPVFRRLSNTLDFWYSDDFDFMRIVHGRDTKHV